MLELVLTVAFSAWSLAQPGAGAITTNELAPPPGMNGPAPAAAQQPAPKKAESAGVPVENAKPVEEAKPQESPAASTETAQPTKEERQEPTQKQASGGGSAGRVAAFWFILPANPQGKK